MNHHLPQANDFRQESQALFQLLSSISSDRFDEATQFKNWTTNDVLQHLHFWNIAANLTLTNEAKLQSLLENALADGTSTVNLRRYEGEYLNGLKGPALLEAWQTTTHELSDLYASTDPKKRLRWAGPTMSATSCISARLMETWAHGQEIYDHFGVERINTDRIKNIAFLGINTFSYTYAVRRKPIPKEIPYVELTAPSGAIWAWGNASETNFVRGSAVEFCQVVTQTRSIQDVNLSVGGTIASEWMSIAQCFAGGPQAPPSKGARFIKQAGNIPL